MLVDVTPRANPDLVSALARLISGGRTDLPRRLAHGVWAWAHWNPDRDVAEKIVGIWTLATKGGGIDDPFCRNCDASGDRVDAAGVCDSLLDIPEHPTYAKLLAMPDRRFTIIGVEIRRAEQPPQGGWRWHKWGEYIGKHEPTCEYLHDEPLIGAVWTFHVYEHAAK